MTLGRFPRAMAVLAASLLSVIAAAQNSQPPSTGLSIPDNIRFVGPATSGIRKATAIVNGEVITESDIDHRLAFIVASQRVTLPPEDSLRNEVSYAIGALTASPRKDAAARYLAFLATREAQELYAGCACSRTRLACAPSPRTSCSSTLAT
mgnify:CR=1 FL=1